MVQRLWSKSKGSSMLEYVMVPKKSTQPLVNEAAEPVQSLSNPTPSLGG